MSEHKPRETVKDSALARDYAELEELLANLPCPPSEDGWREAVLRAALALPPIQFPASSASSLQASPRPWWRGIGWKWAAGGAMLAAVAIVLTLSSWPDTSTPGSQEAIHRIE